MMRNIAKIAFWVLIGIGLFSAPSAKAGSPVGAVSRSQFLTDVGTMLPTNGQGQITAAILRNVMNELANSALFSLITQAGRQKLA